MWAPITTIKKYLLYPVLVQHLRHILESQNFLIIYFELYSSGTARHLTFNEFVSRLLTIL